MKKTMHIIALRTVRYSDSRSILSAYSLEGGRVSFLLSAGKGREAARRRALLMPMGIVVCEADIRPGRTIHAMSEPRMAASLTGIYSNPVKSSVAMFLAEVLSNLLREGEPDPALFQFISRSMEALNLLETRRVGNFHICFLSGLGRFLGIEPDASDYSEGKIFDMLDGTFRLTPPLHSDHLTPAESRIAAMLLRMTYANMHRFRFSRAERNALTDRILQYYTMHYAPLTGLKSLDVVRALF